MNTKFSTKISFPRNEMVVILTYHHPCTSKTRKMFINFDHEK